MRLSAVLAALAVGLLPATAHADPLREFLGFHHCYYEIPARPMLRNETRLVMVEPGYWEHSLRPSAYVELPGSETFYHHRSATAPTAPRAERTAALWHEPVYMPVREPAVIDPGHATLLRADNCWPNRW